jgi:hypothetical protein
MYEDLPPKKILSRKSAKVNSEENARSTGWRKSANVPSLTLLVVRGLDRRVPLHLAVGFFGLPDALPTLFKMVDENKFRNSQFPILEYNHKTAKKPGISRYLFPWNDP